MFLLAPFFFVRKEWRALPAKGISAVYFAALGLGFMFFEITMIQRLVQFLGYPDVLADRDARVDPRLHRDRRARSASRFADARAPRDAGRCSPCSPCSRSSTSSRCRRCSTDSLLSTGPRACGSSFAVVVLAPLGLCLGMFMPLGLGLVASLTDHGDEYVAWSWAVNGFFSVIGSVLTTILSMAFGFRAVQFAGARRLRDRGRRVHRCQRYDP